MSIITAHPSPTIVGCPPFSNTTVEPPLLEECCNTVDNLTNKTITTEKIRMIIKITVILKIFSSHCTLHRVTALCTDFILVCYLKTHLTMIVIIHRTTPVSYRNNFWHNIDVIFPLYLYVVYIHIISIVFSAWHGSFNYAYQGR